MNSTVQIVLQLVDQASSGLSGVTGAIENNRKAISDLAIGAGVVSAAFIAFAKSSIDAYSESEDIVAQLNAVLTSTKGVAGETADAAINLSKSLESTTKYSDEAVLSTENLLLTFTAIKSSVMPQATQTVLDMATALGEDTKDAAIQLGKAMQDPVLGVTALRRVGVDFSKDQQAVIKSLVDTGQSAKAQQLILAELNREFGGSAAAAADTYAGKMAQLQNQINDAQEEIGKALIPVLLQLLTAIVPIVTKVSEWIQEHPELSKWIILIGGGVTTLTAALAAFALVLPGIIAGLGLLGTAVAAAFLPVTAGVAAVTALIAAFKQLQTFINGGGFKGVTAGNFLSALGENLSNPLSMLKTLGIPGFAEGGVVAGPTLAMVGESGPEAIIPLSALGGGSTIGGVGAGRGGVTVNITGGYYLDRSAATEIGNALATLVGKQLKLRNYAT